MNNETSPVVSQESKNLAVLMWIGTIILSFIPGLVFYLIKKDDAYLLDQGTEALNWSITALIGCFAGVILTFVGIGILINLAILLVNLVFCVMGAIAVSKGESYRVPFALRLIK
ncbi:MAG: hypothetical protein HW386_1803 [Gammaproteobacteria bacterium]|nr:hypothetical protein [Gammaproteobacteria bacterium]